MDLLSLSLDDIAKKTRAAEKIAKAKKSKASSVKKTVPDVASKGRPSKKKKHAVVNPNAKTLGGKRKEKTSAPLSTNRAPLKSKSGGGVLVVFSNLEKHITERDVREFLPRRAIESVKLFPGRNGNVAEVKFKSKKLALQAIEDFDDRLLDDRKMRVKLSTRGGATQPASRPDPGRKRDDGRRGKKKEATTVRVVVDKKPKSKAPVKKREPKVEVTTDQLDGDMDDYFKKK